MVTQKEVANLSKVSVATVSRYINRVGFISPEIQEKIENAIKMLGYKPNLVARSLKLKSTKTIGLVFPDIDNPFFIRLVRSAEKLAYNNGYNVILCITENQLEKERLYLDVLKGKLVDGYIVIPASSDDSRLYEVLAGENAVFVDRSTGLRDETVVKLDNVLGVRLAVEHLLELNHKRIGVINIPLELTTGHERFEGYKAIMAERGIEPQPELIKFTDLTAESSCQMTHELLNLDNRPTAILTMGGLTTVGALKAIKDSRLSIPDDISLVCFDESSYSDLLMTPLTTVTQPADEFGARATELLLDMIDGKKPSSKTVVLKPELIVRESCKKI